MAFAPPALDESLRGRIDGSRAVELHEHLLLRCTEVDDELQPRIDVRGLANRDQGRRRVEDLAHRVDVVNGRITFRFADRDEVYETGDAYYAPPGHMPVIDAGTEIVEFSATDAYRQTMAVVAENLAGRANG
jgi:hypothetical protein